MPTWTHHWSYQNHNPTINPMKCWIGSRWERTRGPLLRPPLHWAYSRQRTTHSLSLPKGYINKKTFWSQEMRCSTCERLRAWELLRGTCKLQPEEPSDSGVIPVNVELRAFVSSRAGCPECVHCTKFSVAGSDSVCRQSSRLMTRGQSGLPTRSDRLPSN